MASVERCARSAEALAAAAEDSSETFKSHRWGMRISTSEQSEEQNGLVRDLNPGPRAPEARIMARIHVPKSSHRLDLCPKLRSALDG